MPSAVPGHSRPDLNRAKPAESDEIFGLEDGISQHEIIGFLKGWAGDSPNVAQSMEGLSINGGGGENFSRNLLMVVVVILLIFPNVP